MFRPALDGTLGPKVSAEASTHAILHKRRHRKEDDAVYTLANQANYTAGAGGVAETGAWRQEARGTRLKTDEAHSFKAHNRNPMKGKAASFDGASRSRGPEGTPTLRLDKKCTLLRLVFFPLI